MDITKLLREYQDLLNELVLDIEHGEPTTEHACDYEQRLKRFVLKIEDLNNRAWDLYDECPELIPAARDMQDRIARYLSDRNIPGGNAMD